MAMGMRPGDKLTPEQLDRLKARVAGDPDALKSLEVREDPSIPSVPWEEAAKELPFLRAVAARRKSA